MAIFHLTTKVVSRGKGQSVLASSAYRSGQRLHDYQTGEIKEYKARNERIQFEGVFAPKDAPEWAKDREQLWNAVEAFETRINSRLAREIEIALPHEMTDQQREWLVKDFVREQFTRKGFAVDVAIHAPDKDSDARNYHAHLLITTRSIGPEGFGEKERGHNSKGQLKEWREEWAHLCNRHLERHGHEARIDHRSHAERGLAEEPTIHLGYAAAQMAARGAQSDRLDQLAEILAHNDAIRIADQSRASLPIDEESRRAARASAPTLGHAGMVDVQMKALRYLVERANEQHPPPPPQPDEGRKKQEPAKSYEDRLAEFRARRAAQRGAQQDRDRDDGWER